MTRPIVLIATTNPGAAYALQESLKDDCRMLGLRLDICPDCTKDTSLQIGVYRSAEELFDYLTMCEPTKLADTLVVLDVGTELNNAFRPAASFDSQWHVTKNRAGVAVELLLRFPQVFPVFLSPAVPVPVAEAMNGSDIVEPVLYKHEANQWMSFDLLRKELNIKDKTKVETDDSCAKEFESLHALHVPLNFVSPLDGGRGLKSTLIRFARGMRCWFDPTGLRTLVRNRCLGTVFGSELEWSNTIARRSKLRERLNHVCVAIDEEREFALLCAYTAWKFGRRAWVVTTYGEFHENPLWITQKAPTDNQIDVVILRDIDNRFPDIPDKENVRNNLKDINSDKWKNKIGSNWRVRVVSGEAHITSEESVFIKWIESEGLQETGNVEHWEKYVERAMRLGQVTNPKYCKYLGLRKPIGSIYELKQFLGEEGGKAKNSVLSQIGFSSEPATKQVNRQTEGKKSLGHGAPYFNLAIAEALLKSSGRCTGQSSSHLIGALLAMEAYELLLGMSKTIALEALLALHKHEVAAEVYFPGVSHSLDISERKEDIEQTLNALYENDNKKEAKDKERVKRMFLSQFWAELRIQYKNGEQFDAAEESNIHSLLNMRWTRYGQNIGTGMQYRLKSMILKTATSFSGWFCGALFVSLFFTFLYFFSYYSSSLLSCIQENTCCLSVIARRLSIEGVFVFLRIWSKVVLSMLQMQFNEVPPGDSLNVVVNPSAGASPFAHLLAIAHLSISYILFGILIAMIYRKITRA